MSLASGSWEDAAARRSEKNSLGWISMLQSNRMAVVADDDCSGAKNMPTVQQNVQYYAVAERQTNPDRPGFRPPINRKTGTTWGVGTAWANSEGE